MTAADLVKAMALGFGVACFLAIVIAVVLAWLTESANDTPADRAEDDAAADSVKQALEPLRNEGLL